MGDNSAVATKPDRYETSKGTERIRLKLRPAIIPRSLDELVIHPKGEI